MKPNAGEADSTERQAAGSTAPAIPSRGNPAGETDEWVDSCPPTPPRNDIAQARRKALEQNGDFNWISIVRHNEAEAKLEVEQTAAMEAAANDNFHQGLMQQINRRERERDQKKKDIEAFNKAQKEMFESWKQEEHSKSEKLHKKMAKVKKIRLEQVEELNTRRMREEKKLRYQELREVARLKRELQAEKEKDYKKLLTMKGKMAEMLEDNERQKLKQKRIKDQEATEALKLQKEYAEMLKKQEQSRAKRLAAIYAKQAQKVGQLMAATKDARAGEREAQERADRQRKEYEEFLDQKERTKCNKRKTEQQACNDMIALQIREKEDRIRKEIEEDRAYGKQRLEEAKAADEKDRKKHEAQRRKLLEQEEFLRKQVELIEERKQNEMAEMSQTEKSMNADLMARIKKGPKMKDIKIDPRKPFEWRYKTRRAPF